MRRHPLVILVLLWLTGSPTVALAAPGDPDLGFGIAGAARHDFPGLRESFDAVAVQADGKLVVCGGVDYVSLDAKFAIVRYRADGAVDTSFGVDGLVAIDFPGGADFAYDLLVQPDDKIVAAGQALGAPPSDLDAVLVRYESSGALDPTFGTGGIVVVEFDHQTNVFRSVALQTDGKIIAGGMNTLARFSADGTLDPMFGAGGAVTVPFAIEAIVVQPDGTIVVAGGAASLARFDAVGVLDPTFGAAGIVTGGPGLYTGDLALQADGKLVVAGGASSSDEGFLHRYEADGSPDASFGTGGAVAVAVGERTEVAAVAATPFGLVTVGHIGSNRQKFFMTRHRDDGTLDPTFGARGVVVAFPDINEFLDFEVALAPDGTLLVPFSVATGIIGASELVVARFLGGDVMRCSPAPLAGCVPPSVAGKSALAIKSPVPPLAAKSKILWKWQRGPAGGFGDPLASDDYVFCVYADTDATPTLVAEASAPAGGTCGKKPCWRTTGAGLAYADRDRTPEGVASLALGATAGGLGKLALQVRGANLGAPTVPLALPVRAQLQGEHGACWETRLTAASVQRNDGGKFSGRDAP